MLNTTTVSNFDINRYLGEWHQIATIPAWFQKNLRKVKAKYSLNPDGSIKVENSGIGKTFGFTSKITGTARVKNANNPSALVVKFSPFGEGDYNVLELDENYQWAIVGGSTPDSLWILSRTEYISENLFKN